MNAATMLLAVYFFAYVTSAMTAVMHVAFWSAVLWFLWRKLVRKEPLRLVGGPIPLTMLALVAVFALSLLFNLHWLGDNLDEFRKDHLRNLLAFVIALDSVRSMKQLRPILLALALGFTLRALALIGFYWGEIQYFAPYRPGFAMEAVFCFSITAILCLFDKELTWRVRLLLAVGLLVQLIPLLLHGSRTPIIAIVLGLFVTFALGQYKKTISILVFSGILVGAGAGVMLAKQDLVGRYTSPFKMETYENDFAFLERRGIWWVTGHLIAQQPLLGYGPGWRKLSSIARQNGYVEMLAGSKERYLVYGHNYFKRCGYGCANPHNLFLQVSFEVGLLGMFAYLAFLAALVYSAFRLWQSKVRDNALLASLTVALVAGYMAVSFADGLWAGSGILLVLAAVVANSYQTARQPS